MELRSLAPRAVPAGASRRGPACPLCGRLWHRRAEQQLLPLAPAGGVWQLRDRLPEGFRLSVKAPRGLTHARKLYAPEAWLQRIAAGWHELDDKRAVLLVQLPPSQPRDDTRLAYFLRLVPGWVRVAVEFRHRSWHGEEIFALLEEHRAAYCVMSGANLPCTLVRWRPGRAHSTPRPQCPPAGRRARRPTARPARPSPRAPRPCPCATAA
jgi:hypothetical protein